MVEHRITDPQCEGPHSFNAVERLVLPLLKDPRDMIFVRTAALMSVVVMPCAALLFFLPWWGVFALALPYIGLVFAGFAGRYGLMLHAVGHRPIFKKKVHFLNWYITVLMTPLTGHTYTSFASHHIHMHHAENNMLGDGSTTLTYVRDDFGQFVHYWARFFFFSYLHMPIYYFRRRKGRIWWLMMAGELGWFATAALAIWINWAAGLVVIVLPLLMMRWFLMCGNFAQHSFVDVDDADNPFRNSTNLTNTRYNHKCYNDGYHIVHHLDAGMHWSEMPGFYLRNIEEFARQDAIVFDGIRDNQQIWFLLMTKNYDKLANHLVNFHDRTHEEKVAFLKDRVRRTTGVRKGLLYRETQPDVERTRRPGPLAEPILAK